MNDDKRCVEYDVNEVDELLRAGHSLRSIAREMNKSESALRSWLKRKGYELQAMQWLIKVK